MGFPLLLMLTKERPQHLAPYRRCSGHAVSSYDQFSHYPARYGKSGQMTGRRIPRHAPEAVACWPGPDASALCSGVLVKSMRAGSRRSLRTRHLSEARLQSCGCEPDCREKRVVKLPIVTLGLTGSASGIPKATSKLLADTRHAVCDAGRHPAHARRTGTAAYARRARRIRGCDLGTVRTAR